MKLIIVESPTKAKTITKFLGSDFIIESSFGHVRDLPTSTMGIDLENNFQPKYIIPAKASKNVSKLKALAKKAEEIILATDEDREGEAIAWHLAEVLKLKAKEAKRIVFHEITKDAIIKALANPRQLDFKQVDAQQARRILDRLVGYELSPFLWKKVARGLSAGRVQSVAMRLIVEREREIQKFKTNEYWSIVANLENNQKISLLVRLNKIENKTVNKLEIPSDEVATKILDELANAIYQVSNVSQKQIKKSPPKPFTTSSLQQTANRWLGFSAKQTMMVAQQLYEQGFITYMRTDSLNLSDKFLNDAHDFLKTNLGDNYTLTTPRKFKTKSKGAQEAHEAIRPAEVTKTPEKLEKTLNSNQHRLYKLIWQRALASQMPEALAKATTIDIDGVGTKYQFRATGQVLEFAGYLKIYPEKSQEIELPNLKQDEKLNLIELKKEQHFTKPPARYSDAGLVKIMEEYGIGRPSTYAPTISTIINRNYVQRDDNKKLAPTDIAFIVNDLLVEHFPQIVDYQFTAKMENKLDDIANGQIEWQPIISEFYKPFHENLEIKRNLIKKENIMPEEKSDKLCDKCNAPMIVKTGRYGKFLACSGFPECKNIKPMEGSANNNEKSDAIKELEEKYKNEVCEKCGAPMTVKNGRFGAFLGCSGYPKCKNIKNLAGEGASNSNTGITCPVCGVGEIVQKQSRRGTFYACNQYPTCKTAFWGKPTGEKCPNCDSLLVEDAKKGETKCSKKGCGYTK
ncbi:type I DNA topoisomerase [Patescibacteria group bacterium]|nr:type I DNA topoisomerase [Patescibacteria group bacterium]MBU0880109.1 type I DNA topoisomerase [Patescibacteria group bacterium]MBU1063017.1 type I DNA topoisomerase [Patescibacteria group bacterium]MBU1783334.1 type I DNA topoisomerase [Patescibacteria group bacterium]